MRPCMAELVSALGQLHIHAVSSSPACASFLPGFLTGPVAFPRTRILHDRHRRITDIFPSKA